MRETYRKARVTHVCFGCDETIRTGDRYRYLSGVWDHKGESFKHCIRCAALLDALPSGAMLGLDCGEVWEDPPEHIAALAFWTPGDPVPVQLVEHGWVRSVEASWSRMFEGSVKASVHCRTDSQRYVWHVIVHEATIYSGHVISRRWCDSEAEDEAKRQAEAAAMTVVASALSQVKERA